MRVISGTAKGKKLKSPENQDVRPTLDRIKEDIFNIVGPAIRGKKVLDLFAGSGALGIEALSRGAALCCFADKDKKSLDLVKFNLGNTGLFDKAELYQMDFDLALQKVALKGLTFDYIFVDPPYNMRIAQTILQKLEKCNIIQENTYIILETDIAEAVLEKTEKFVKIREKTYKSTKITIYQGARDNE